MNNYGRLALILAAISLSLTFFFPLWTIILEAPQYPEGIEMYIWINKITGSSEYTLQNVNILNHYIGMKPIHPDSIPELKYFPWIAGGMIALAIIFAAIGNIWLARIWGSIMFVLAFLGLYDFYLWEYDYGHNLDPNAPISIPGMTYQPPFIGTKYLLNFVATSLPNVGGFALGAAWVFGVITWHHFFKRTVRIGAAMAGAAAAAAAMLASCSTGPQQIAYGEDLCAYCEMTITDSRFGSEHVTDKGRIYKFDSIECMADYANEQNATGAFYVTCFDKPNELQNADNCSFVISKQIPSPMGGFISAYDTEPKAISVVEQAGGELLNWKALRERRL
ncbi:MAG: nitrous oxide reductase accessory protein NosL [Flavobacteriales bacterium]|nr:nitrous oxide reductase accessory protein NosL [Flavobacteriales bacterium]